MRVLLLNTTAQRGGAAIAASRLMKALQSNGVQTAMMVSRGQEAGPDVIRPVGKIRCQSAFLKERWEIFKSYGYSRKNLFAVDTASTGVDITGHPTFKEADIVHLHWINQGFVSLRVLEKILQSDKPVVWTLHDMWPFTGICHYAGDCTRYRSCCDECPQLLRPTFQDISWRTFEQKRKLFDKYSVHFVAVSSWLAQQAKDSQLLCHQPISVIPNVLPLQQFSIRDSKSSRMKLHLPSDKIILVFGAVKIEDPRKGLVYMNRAIRLLIEQGEVKRDQLHVALFGGIKDAAVLEEIPVEYTHFGFMEVEELSCLYSASDVAVIPSMYETFGQTVIEAQACGCIPVTFTGSGQMDIIQHKLNGYLAEQRSVEDLAAGILWGIHHPAEPATLRESVLKRYSEEIVSKQYIDLYNQLSNP